MRRKKALKFRRRRRKQARNLRKTWWSRIEISPFSFCTIWWWRKTTLCVHKQSIKISTDELKTKKKKKLKQLHEVKSHMCNAPNETKWTKNVKWLNEHAQQRTRWMNEKWCERMKRQKFRCVVFVDRRTIQRHKQRSDSNVCTNANKRCSRPSKNRMPTSHMRQYRLILTLQRHTTQHLMASLFHIRICDERSRAA